MLRGGASPGRAGQTQSSLFSGQVLGHLAWVLPGHPLQAASWCLSVPIGKEGGVGLDPVPAAQELTRGRAQ